MRHPFRALIASTAPRSLLVLASLALPSLAAGCSDSPTTDKPPSAGTIQLTDANNFTTNESTLNIPTIETAAASNLDVDWSALKKDIQCHDVDPAADIDAVLFLRFKSTSQSEVSALLDDGDLSSNDLVAPAPFKIEPSGSTSAKLKDFDNNGTAVDPSANYPEDDHVYLMVFQNGTNLGQGARSMVFLKPVSDSNNTKVSTPPNDDCGLLSFDADLQSLTPVPVTKTGPWVLDWTNVQHDSQGKPLERAKIDRMLIGFYKDQTAADLEDHFLDLEQIPTASWELKLDAISKANLGSAKNRDGSGEAFPGFDTGSDKGTWIMGLFCDTCQSPAPFVVTILEPAE